MLDYTSLVGVQGSIRALELFICVELLHIFLRSYFNVLFVFVSFVILFHDFGCWIFLLQLWILNPFMSSNTCSSHWLFGLPLPLPKSSVCTNFFSPILVMWPYHHSLCVFMAFTTSSPCYLSWTSEFISLW